MENLFLNLLNISITAGYLVIAVLLLRSLLKKAPKYVRCILWGLVGVRLLFPFSVESVLSLIPSAQTVPQEILYSPQPQIHSGIPVINSVVNPVLSQSMAPTQTYSANPMQVVVAVAWNVWLLGMVAMALYAIISYLRLRHKLREAAPDSENIWQCDGIGSAFLLGIVKPRIYLPSDLCGESKAFVIAHEKAHLQRKDHWWKPLGYLLLMVYWFNPLMWVAYIFLCRDIEYACDEKVIKQLGVDCKKAYSEALIGCSIPRKMISACPVAFGEDGVKGRVKSILNYKKPTFWIILIALGLCIVVAVCFLTNPVEPASLLGYVYETGKCHYSYVVDKDKETRTNEVSFLIDTAGSVTKKYGDNLQEHLGQLEIVEYDLQTLNQALKQQDGVSLFLGRKGTAYEICNAEGVRDCIFFHKSNGDVIYISFFSDGRVMTVFELYRKGKTPLAELEFSFNATVVEIKENAILVVPSFYEDELQIADRFLIPVIQQLLDGIAIGDTVWIAYDGMVEELYPARIPNVRLVKVMAGSNSYTDPGRAFSSAYFDIDGDGVTEDCYLNYGPTSGVFTFVVTAYENNVLEYATIYTTQHTTLAFNTLENGKTVIEGIPNTAPEEKLVFEISVSDGVIVLKGDGAPVQLWGSEDFTIPTTSYLRKNYPQFFGLSTSKGLEVYVWYNGTWRCGVRSATNRDATREELMAFRGGADLTQMAMILQSYGIPATDVAIRYDYNPAFSGPYDVFPSQAEQDQIRAILTKGLDPVTLPLNLTGTTVNSDQQYPLLIYAYQMAENAWRFQFVEDAKPAASVLDIIDLPSVIASDAKKKLAQYDIPEENIVVIVYHNLYSSYIYTNDEATRASVLDALGLD